MAYFNKTNNLEEGVNIKDFDFLFVKFNFGENKLN